MKCPRHDYEYEENSHCLKCVEEEVIFGMDAETVMSYYAQLYLLTARYRDCLNELIDAYPHINDTAMIAAVRKAKRLVLAEFPRKLGD